MSFHKADAYLSYVRFVSLFTLSHRVYFGIFGCITRKVLPYQTEAYSSYVRVDMGVPDEVRRQIAQNKNVEGANLNILQHFGNSHFCEMLVYVDRVAWLAVKGCPFLCSLILTIYPNYVKRNDQFFNFSSRHFFDFVGFRFFADSIPCFSVKNAYFCPKFLHHFNATKYVNLVDESPIWL